MHTRWLFVHHHLTPIQAAWEFQNSKANMEGAMQSLYYAPITPIAINKGKENLMNSLYSYSSNNEAPYTPNINSTVPITPSSACGMRCVATPKSLPPTSSNSKNYYTP
jgi:hypothetical protein